MKSIKRLSLILATAFTLGSGLAMAQDTPVKQRNADPKARAERMTERMAKEYNLNDNQKQQVLELNQALAEKIGDCQGKPHMRHDKKGKHKQVADAKRSGKEGKRVERDNKEKRNNRDVVRTDRGQRKDRPNTPKISPEEREKKIAEMKQVRSDYNTSLQKIMNAEQFQAFSKKEAAQEQKRAERAEKMKEQRIKKENTTQKSTPNV